MRLDRLSFVRLLAVTVLCSGMVEFFACIRENTSALYAGGRSILIGGGSLALNTTIVCFLLVRGILPIAKAGTGMGLLFLFPLARVCTVVVVTLDFVLRVAGYVAASLTIRSLDAVNYPIVAYFHNWPSYLTTVVSLLDLTLLSTRFVKEPLEQREIHHKEQVQVRNTIITMIILAIVIPPLPFISMKLRLARIQSAPPRKSVGPGDYVWLKDIHYQRALASLIPKGLNGDTKACARISFPYVRSGQGVPFDTVRHCYWAIRAHPPGTPNSEDEMQRLVEFYPAEFERAKQWIDSGYQDTWHMPIPPLVVSTVGPVHRWAIAVSAIFSGVKHEPLDRLEPCDWSELPKVERAINNLYEGWKVQRREDLLETLSWLEKEGHRTSFLEMATYLQQLSDTDFSLLLKKHLSDPSVTNQLSIARKYGPIFGGKSIIAWDLCRYNMLCRYGYLADYLSEQEAWDRMFKVARELQRQFTSWDDMGLNCIIGREWWSLLQTQRHGNEYRVAFEQLKNDPSSPWRELPWTLNLTGPQGTNVIGRE